MSQVDQHTIQRCPHDKENPYVMVSAALIRDASISPECRWLLIYLLSNAPGWKIKIKQVANHVKGHIGRDRVYDLFKEACDAGYMMKEEGFGYCRYFISETPKFKKCLQFPENQDTGYQDTENQDALSSNNSYKNNQKKRKPPNPQKGEAPEGAGDMVSFGKFVKLTKEDYDILCASNSNSVIDGLIEEINDYLASSGKKPYKDYAAVLRQWLRRRRETSQGPNSVTNDWLEKVKEKIKPYPQFSINEHGFTISNGPHEKMIKSSEGGYKERIMKGLQGLGIPVDDLR